MRGSGPSPGRRVKRATAAVVATTALALSACGSDEEGEAAQREPTVELPDLSGESLEVGAVWTGAERDNFVRVTEEFERRTGASVTVVPSGDNVSQFVGTKIEGGAPPDVVMVPQPGVLREFADNGWIAPLGETTRAQLDANYTEGWQQLAAGGDGDLYGVYVKAANKSLVWYSSTAFDYAGVSAPDTWDAFVDTAWTVWESGTTPVSVAGGDGWTLTDWFENIYLSQAGPEMYDRLAAHEIPWTDESVTEALTTLGELFGEGRLLLGGQSGSLQTDFPTSVTNTFSNLTTPDAGMVFEADFVGSVITDNTDAEVGVDARVFPFPAVGAGDPPVVSAGDAAVAVAPDGEMSEAQEAFLTYLASTDAAAIWAEPGGFVSPNKSLEFDVYPNDVQRGIAEALIAAGDDFRFDMSDQTPAAFGGTTGQGMWQGLQNFLRDPDDIERAQEYLESQAADAYGH
ncbi:carbohydrate ABC transporter substrate-binding protein, CUT1 family [Streptomyces zhaozhouensis]|uniref:Carbohydrate ABC transporter substrate-binding protein, CUT1 family n=1 Tax=Streptomyces zhaozhouensis TaxID=1300267 RepID=A0A286E232_9ACTN|nr:ABC transporter substrate-binding protein [Streptomyces zhaozhouensis]SOD64953.1 carbohydrate ABC transporter substrate-binding protein, CUT1 family [Streptomyces zhaozhouensis]